MKITICGSVKFIKQMDSAKSFLESRGHAVLLPISAEQDQDTAWWNKLKLEDMRKFISLKSERIKAHFPKIKSSDAILVLNYDKDGKQGYIGPNTLMEIAIAFEHGKRIYILNDLPDDSLYEEVISMLPVCLNGDLEKLQ